MFSCGIYTYKKFGGGLFKAVAINIILQYYPFADGQSCNALTEGFKKRLDVRRQSRPNFRLIRRYSNNDLFTFLSGFSESLIIPNHKAHKKKKYFSRHIGYGKKLKINTDKLLNSPNGNIAKHRHGKENCILARGDSAGFFRPYNQNRHNHKIQDNISRVKVMQGRIAFYQNGHSFYAVNMHR